MRDPLVGTGGGYYSSGSFRLFGSGDTAFTGRNSSASFSGKYGFLYFPEGTPGVIIPPTSGGGGGGGNNARNPDYVPGVLHSCARIADFNCDGYVDILDLSILLYYSDKSGEVIKPFDLSNDRKIDLEDISIVFYYWDFNITQEQR